MVVLYLTVKPSQCASADDVKGCQGNRKMQRNVTLGLSIQDFAGLQVIGTNDPRRTIVEEDMESNDGMGEDMIHQPFEQTADGKPVLEE